ncbi:RNA polymerase sigma-70 factor (ECF subfamily) [Kerstersia gyiorum]|jgi:RNA polymerase sigma-70 factor (ECF subfamily)|uniref:RNA polymerase sigma-70 factor (ECF subfamily) n=3 Tax=Kerstersia gyiorum TaxID=206506 RepID=A0A4Q7MXV8_9BURK|nr:RNA polymerase sigma-70 factor (ECF subfamily) [Kerstersia gyiorum]
MRININLMSGLASMNGTLAAHLYDSHYGWLERWLRRWVSTPADAADFAQDTFVQLLIRKGGVDIGDNPRALLVRIAKARLIDHWRHQEVERIYLEALAAQPEAEAPSPESILLVREALMRIDAMLGAMPERTRTIFLMVRVDGMRHAEIAERLGMAETSVKRHVQRAYLACLSLAAS